MAAEIDYSNTTTELESWFGMDNPTFMLITLGIYLLIVLKLGPSFMKNRKPYELKTFITYYNVSQVVACVYIVYMIFYIASPNVIHFWKCVLFPSNSYHEYLYNRLIYGVVWLKYMELTETVVFVLRKKQNQVSFLHVFHHCSTITLFYIVPGYKNGSSLYPILLNCIVHIFMYMYYLAAAVCDKRIVRRMLPIKKSITTVQMIQFCLILIQTFCMVLYCNVPAYIIYYYTVVISVIFYQFYAFYRRSYLVKSRPVKAK